MKKQYVVSKVCRNTYKIERYVNGVLEGSVSVEELEVPYVLSVLKTDGYVEAFYIEDEELAFSKAKERYENALKNPVVKIE